MKNDFYFWLYQSRVSHFSSADAIICVRVSKTGVLHLKPHFLGGCTDSARTFPNLQEGKKLGEQHLHV